MHDGSIIADGNQHFRGNPAMIIPINAISPQRSSPVLQHYRTFHFHYCGFPMVLLLSSLPCSCLLVVKRRVLH